MTAKSYIYMKRTEKGYLSLKILYTEFHEQRKQNFIRNLFESVYVTLFSQNLHSKPHTIINKKN